MYYKVYIFCLSNLKKDWTMPNRKSPRLQTDNSSWNILMCFFSNINKSFWCMLMSCFLFSSTTETLKPSVHFPILYKINFLFFGLSFFSSKDASDVFGIIWDILGRSTVFIKLINLYLYLLHAQLWVSKMNAPRNPGNGHVLFLLFPLTNFYFRPKKKFHNVEVTLSPSDQGTSIRYRFLENLFI